MFYNRSSNTLQAGATPVLARPDERFWSGKAVVVAGKE